MEYTANVSMTIFCEDEVDEKEIKEILEVVMTTIKYPPEIRIETVFNLHEEED